MIFKVRPGIKKQFDTVHNFGVKNLIVSGCSFTYNNHESAAVTWPYYLKDLGNFTEVLDCSLPGAGNGHISNSLQWALENTPTNDSLIVVMWSGNDRDDYISPRSNINNYPFQFHYSKNTVTGITGGSDDQSKGNTICGFKEFAQTKTPESRAIENYLYILGLWNYLTVNKYKFVFLDYIDRSLPSRTKDFEIQEYLPETAKTKLDSMITQMPTPYEWAIKNNLLISDDFHPSPDGHLDWTKQVLLPYLQTQFD
jgi:hypothetical protein